MEVYNVNMNPFDEFANGWALVTAGNKEHYNTMTVSWGGLGILWNKCVCTVYVKPCRYTWNFMEESDTFTVSFYDAAYKKDLGILGSKSGKDGDKVALTQLTPVEIGDGVTFKEAKRTFVCKKLYSAPFIADRVPEFAHEKYYTDEAEHHIYIGEIIEMKEGE